MEGTKGVRSNAFLLLLILHFQAPCISGAATISDRKEAEIPLQMNFHCQVAKNDHQDQTREEKGGFLGCVFTGKPRDDLLLIAARERKSSPPPPVGHGVKWRLLRLWVYGSSGKCGGDFRKWSSSLEDWMARNCNGDTEWMGNLRDVRK